MNKNTFKFISLTILCLGLSLNSCKDYLDVNDDPNQSSVSSDALQLSAAQLQIAIGIGERIFPRLNVLCQWHTGGPGVALGDPDQQKWASSEGNQVFRNLYRASNNLNYIVNNSAAPNYVAIAKILRAYSFQVCADLFGNIPYTDALRGDIADGSILHPAYDNAETVVYPGIEKELTDAIALIENNVGGTHPDADDLMYHGDMEGWYKFANSLLLKIYLRQGPSGQTKAAALYRDDNQFILSNSEAAYVPFTGGSEGSNPFWNAAKSTALGNFYAATTTVLDALDITQDPRKEYLFEPNSAGNFAGLFPGDIQNQPLSATFAAPNGAKAANGGIIFSPTAPVFLMSAWESNLLLAEAAARGWITPTGGTAADEYMYAVYESFDYLGLSTTEADTYLTGLAAYPTGGTLDEQISIIAYQKWISMAGIQPVEGWIETRRYDSPSLPIFYSQPGGLFESPTENALGPGVFISILPYPENEESLNQSFPGQHPVTDKVFWDN